MVKSLSTALLASASLILLGAIVFISADLEEATRVQNKYFYYDDRNQGDTDIQMSWEEALEYCNENNMNLATIRNNQENEAVAQFLKKFGRSVFLGGSDKLSKGNWYWKHTRKPITYKNWDANQPDSGDYSHCMFMSSSNGKWSTGYCDVPHSRPLCEDVKSG